MQLKSVKKDRKRNYNFGINSEMLASVYLKLKGYSILARRYKTFAGEVDLIARKGKKVVFVEVKARSRENLKENNMEVVSRHQVKRISNAASLFLAKNSGLANLDTRFDLIIISHFGWPVHIKNAWDLNW